MFRPHLAVAALAAATLAVGACQGSGGSVGPVLATTSVDGASTTDDLREWQRRWDALDLDDYDFDLRITCFCAPPVGQPVVVHVRGGRVTAVTPQGDGAAAEPSFYPTIDTLFVRAIAARERGDSVTGKFDREYGYPTQLVIGDLAADAGVGYEVSSVRGAK